MSWADLVRTKHFGSIFLPWAENIADIAIAVDNMVARDPAFARFIPPITQRDLCFVYGKRLMVLGLSRSMHKHYPTRHGVEWEKFFRVSEDEFIARHPGVDSSVLRVDIPEVISNLANDVFVHPLVFAFPHCFPAVDEQDKAKRARVVEEGARVIIDLERHLYTEHLEMQKPKDIFLSHKSADKGLVREIAATLRAVGLSPWLDEDRVKAGASLERAILKGFEDSCAAVFFITPNFVDEKFLASEVEYAISSKREKGDRFSIITLQITDETGAAGAVPALLRPYVWKTVKPIEVVRTIVEALPIRCGEPVWR